MLSSFPYFIRSERGCYETKYYLWKYFLLGLSIFLYPTVSNWFATRTHYSEVSTYDEAVKKLEKEEIDRKETEAREYNKKVQNTARKHFRTRFMKRVMRKKVHM